MVHESSLREGSNHDRWHAGTVAPDPIGGRWRDVIPPPSMLIVSDDDERVVPVVAVLHGIDQIRDVLLPLLQARIPGCSLSGPSGLINTTEGRCSFFKSVKKSFSSCKCAAEAGLR